MNSEDRKFIGEIKSKLDSIESFDYKLLKNVIVKLQELEIKRKEDHILLLKLTGTVEELALVSGDWKILRRTVVWLVAALSGFIAYFFGKD